MKKGREILTSEADKKDDYIGDAKHVTFGTEVEAEQNDVAINMHSIIVSLKEHALQRVLLKQINFSNFTADIILLGFILFR